jgi:hypothetical protein
MGLGGMAEDCPGCQAERSLWGALVLADEYAAHVAWNDTITESLDHMAASGANCPRPEDPRSQPSAAAGEGPVEAGRGPLCIFVGVFWVENGVMRPVSEVEGVEGDVCDYDAPGVPACTDAPRNLSALNGVM